MLSNDENLVMHHADTEMTDYDTYYRRFQPPQGVKLTSYRGQQGLVSFVLLLHYLDTHMFIPSFLFNLMVQLSFSRPRFIEGTDEVGSSY
jgi:hypothetical protein